MSNHFTITGNLGRDGLGGLRFTPSVLAARPELHETPDPERPRPERTTR